MADFACTSERFVVGNGCLPEVGSLQVGTDEMGALQMRPAQVCALQKGGGQGGIPQVRLLEPGIPKIGCSWLMHQ